jgi:large subunit ribosomal protein L28
MAMARRCAVSGKNVMVGNNVSHANNKTKRTFRPNLQSVTLMSDTLGSKVRLRLTTHALRTIEHNGGLDSYLLSAGASKLTPEIQKLKRQLVRAKAKKESAAA